MDCLADPVCANARPRRLDILCVSASPAQPQQPHDPWQRHVRLDLPSQLVRKANGKEVFALTRQPSEMDHRIWRWGNVGWEPEKHSPGRSALRLGNCT